MDAIQNFLNLSFMICSCAIGSLSPASTEGKKLGSSAGRGEGEREGEVRRGAFTAGFPRDGPVVAWEGFFSDSDSDSDSDEEDDEEDVDSASLFCTIAGFATVGRVSSSDHSSADEEDDEEDEAARRFRFL